jgi:hypothetical protein
MTQPPLRNLIGIRLRPPLVGWDAEVAALDEQLALARTGAFRVLLVTGEPGMASPVWSASSPNGTATLRVVVGSRAFELGMTYSLALWVEAFERLLGSAPSAEVLRLCGSSVRDLALVLRPARRALGGAPDTSDPEPDHEPGVRVRQAEERNLYQETLPFLPRCQQATFERAMHDPEAGDALTAEMFAQCDWLSGRLDDLVRRVSQCAARRPLAGSR